MGSVVIHTQGIYWILLALLYSQRTLAATEDGEARADRETRETEGNGGPFSAQLYGELLFRKYSQTLYTESFMLQLLLH